MLLFHDGFDHYATAQAVSGQKWDSVLNATIGSTYARSGGQGCQLGNSGANLGRVVPTGNNYIIGAAFNLATGSISGEMFSFWDGASHQCSVCVASDGTITVQRGAIGGTVLGTAATKFPLASYHYLEAKAFVDNITGSVTVRLDGTPILTVAAVNTRTTSNSQITKVAIGNVAASQTWWIDDVYICDTTTPNSAGNNNSDFLGDVKVSGYVASSAGGFTNWTRGGTDSGNDFSQVNELTPPDEDTKYITDATIGDRDSFKFPSISLVGTIFGATLWTRARKDDAGTRTLSNVARSSAVDTIGPTYNLAAAYQYYGTVFELDPATSVKWGPAGLNAAEFGVKTIA